MVYMLTSSCTSEYSSSGSYLVSLYDDMFPAIEYILSDNNYISLQIVMKKIPLSVFHKLFQNVTLAV